MRVLQYGIAAIVETIFFLGIAALIGAGITHMINRKPRKPNVMYRAAGRPTGRPRITSATHIQQWTAIPPVRSPNYRQPRYGFWERLRAMYYGYKIERLAASVERKLERKQRRAERWQTTHRLE